jgi:hypothetical protein
MTGTLDEIGAYIRSLAITEVAALFNTGAANQYPFATTPTPPPIVSAQRSFTGVLF